MPLVSIIIPCYNVAPFMKKCLDTVCAQTLRNIQIICINDGSGDGTLDILREYEAADERFVVIDQPNAGVAAARNAGLDAASGEYIGFVDPDDYISPVMFQRLYLAAEEYRADVACMGATIAGDMPLSVRWSMLNGLQCPEWHCGHYDFCNDGAVQRTVLGQAVPGGIPEKTGLRFRSGMKQGSDALFNNLLQPYVKRIVKIPDCLYIYRPTRPDSLVNVYKAPDKKGFRLLSGSGTHRPDCGGLPGTGRAGKSRDYGAELAERQHPALFLQPVEPDGGRKKGGSGRRPDAAGQI